MDGDFLIIKKKYERKFYLKNKKSILLQYFTSRFKFEVMGSIPVSTRKNLKGIMLIYVLSMFTSYGSYGNK